MHCARLVRKIPADLLARIANGEDVEVPLISSTLEAAGETR